MLFLAFLAVLAWSGYEPHDRFTWLLEVAPAVLGGALLAQLTLARCQDRQLGRLC